MTVDPISHEPKLVDGHIAMYYQYTHFDLIFKESNESFVLIDRYNSHQKDSKEYPMITNYGNMSRSEIIELMKLVDKYCDIEDHEHLSGNQIHGEILYLAHCCKTIYDHMEFGFRPRFCIGHKCFVFRGYTAFIDPDPDVDGREAEQIVVTRRDDAGVLETKKFMLCAKSIYDIVSYIMWVR